MAQAAGAAGQLVYGVHISLAPTWFDPAETQGIITPYMLLYALHDGAGEADAGPAACPMPGAVLVGGGRRHELRASCCARRRCSTTARPVTAEDVKFSFERYRGAAHALLKERVAGGRCRSIRSMCASD